MRTALTIAFVSAFGLMAVFGVAVMSHGTETGMMEHCPFAPGSSSMCPMNTLLHMEHWQGLFTATQTFGLFALLAIAVGLVVRYGRFPVPRMPTGTVFRERFENDIRAVSDFLLSAFSAGILHSRVYT